MHERLKKLRKEHGYTQEQLAQKLFTTRQTISNWENCRSLPDRENMKRLSEIYETSVEMILTGKEPLAIDQDIPERKRNIQAFLSLSFLLLAFIPFTSIISLMLLFLWKRYLNEKFYKISLYLLTGILFINVTATIWLVFLFM